MSKEKLRSMILFCCSTILLLGLSWIMWPNKNHEDLIEIQLGFPKDLNDIDKSMPTKLLLIITIWMFSALTFLASLPDCIKMLLSSFQKISLTCNSKSLISNNKTEKCLINLSFWIPRKHREAIVGDIMEDVHELRTLGKSERRIRIHIIWQIVIALILLRPAALMDAFKRIWSTR